MFDVSSGTAFSGAQICVLKLYNTDESQHRILQFTEHGKYVLSLHRSGKSVVSLLSDKDNSRNAASFNILHAVYHVIIQLSYNLLHTVTNLFFFFSLIAIYMLTDFIMPSRRKNG